MIRKDHKQELEKGHNDWNARLVELFVNNPRLVMMLVLAVVIGGTSGLLSLRREGFPAIPVKILMVQTVYPGAGSEEVERQITKPIEEGLEGAEGIKETNSMSMNSFSNVTVTLEQKADIDKVTQELRNKLSTVESELPEDAEKPDINRFETGGPAFIIGVAGGTGPARRDLIDEVNQVPGVKSVKELVEKEERIVIRVKSDKLKKSGIPVDRLVGIIKGSNVDFPIGRLDLDGKNQSLVVRGALSSIGQLRKLAVGVDQRTGSPVTLRSVADISAEETGEDKIDRFGSASAEKAVAIREGSLLAVRLTDGVDMIRTKELIDEKLAQLRRDELLSKRVKVEFILDEALASRKQIDEIVGGAIGSRRNLWILGGIQLVLIAMLIFVNFRAAVLAALSIPLSLGVTFIALQVMGLAFNTIVLFSLVLVLGLIVDPAIVIVESLQRYRDLGFTPRESVIATGRRYGAGVFMATLTNWIVFIPFGVVSGIFGEIIRYIPLTVIPALIASYFVPIAVLPMFSERFLRARPVKDESADESESLWAAARGMMRVNEWILARWWRGVLVLAVALGLTGLSMNLVGSGNVRVVQFSTPEDNDRLVATIKFDKGLRAAQRNIIARGFERNLKQEPGVATFFYQEQDRDKLVAFLTLKNERDEDDRSKKIVARLGRAMDGGKDFEFQGAELSYAPPTEEYQVQVQLYDNNLSTLKKAAMDVGSFIKDLDGVEKVDDGVNSDSEPEVRVVLDRDKAEKLGLGGFQVGQALKAVFDETNVGKFDDKENDRTMDIVLKGDVGDRPEQIKKLEEVMISGAAGRPVPLSEISEIEETQGLARIQRFDGQRFLTVRARVDEDSLISVQRKVDRFLAPDKLKELEISGTGNKGEYEDIAQSFTELFIALLIAIGLTYLVLVLQFRSFSQPMIMLFTIPPSFIGVFPALWLLGSQFGFLELLGITILVGIVENVAIFLLDYANQLVRQDGMDPKDAIILASGVRFRPIILTKLVAFGGLLPLAIESPFWRGLAVTIMAGIGLSGLFSMMIIPILYVAIDRLERRLGIEF